MKMKNAITKELTIRKQYYDYEKNWDCQIGDYDSRERIVLYLADLKQDNGNSYCHY